MDRDRFKVYISIAIVLFAGIAVVLVGSGSSSSAEHDDGVIVDFGGHDAVWVSVDFSKYPDPMTSLEYVCAEKGYTLISSGENIVVSINGKPLSGSDMKWSLWVVNKGQTDWKKVAEQDIASLDPSSVSAVAWALCSPKGQPSVPGVDQTGQAYHDYTGVRRVVTLAPSVTEMTCAVGGSNTIIGTDLYSNYPDSIMNRKASGKITVVGGFTNPSYEKILKLDPDIVICDGGQASHRVVAEKLRNAGVDAVVLYAGESLDTLYNNLYIIGTAIGFDSGKNVAISEIKNGVSSVLSDMSEIAPLEKSLLVSLSAVKSPWVAGSDTYINDIVDLIYGSNIFDSEHGWVMVNSEMIVKASPEKIIVVSSAKATEENYQKMIQQISEGWASMNADIYMICESASDLISRPGPRLAQVTELIARILHPNAFQDVIVMPHYIGDDYRDYLTYTKNLDFNR